MTNLIDALHIPDTQSARDDRHLAIQRVGIRGVRYPLQLRIGTTLAPTVAEWDLDVALPAEQKGTHMSRFVAWLDAAGIEESIRKRFGLTLARVRAAANH